MHQASIVAEQRLKGAALTSANLQEAMTILHGTAKGSGALGTQDEESKETNDTKRQPTGPPRRDRRGGAPPPVEETSLLSPGNGSRVECPLRGVGKR